MISPLELFKLQNTPALWQDRNYVIPGEVFKFSEHRAHHFEISNYGRMFNMSGAGIALGTTHGSRHKNTPLQNAQSYPRAWLNGKINSRVHLLVYKAFVGPITPGRVIDHINGCMFDCRVTNLRECTRRENTLYCRGFEQKLSKYLITRVIRRMRLVNGVWMLL